MRLLLGHNFKFAYSQRIFENKLNHLKQIKYQMISVLHRRAIAIE